MLTLVADDAQPEEPTSAKRIVAIGEKWLNEHFAYGLDRDLRAMLDGPPEEMRLTAFRITIRRKMIACLVAEACEVPIDGPVALEALRRFFQMVTAHEAMVSPQDGEALERRLLEMQHVGREANVVPLQRRGDPPSAA